MDEINPNWYDLSKIKVGDKIRIRDYDEIINLNTIYKFVSLSEEIYIRYRDVKDLYVSEIIPMSVNDKPALKIFMSDDGRATEDWLYYPFEVDVVSSFIVDLL